MIKFYFLAYLFNWINFDFNWIKFKKSFIFRSEKFDIDVDDDESVKSPPASPSGGEKRPRPSDDDATTEEARDNWPERKKTRTDGEQPLDLSKSTKSDHMSPKYDFTLILIFFLNFQLIELKLIELKLIELKLIELK